MGSLTHMYPRVAITQNIIAREKEEERETFGRVGWHP